MADPLVTSGWDVGGVNVKAARVTWAGGRPMDVRTVVRPFEIWRAVDDLTTVLRDAAAELGLDDSRPAALTMTAELSDVFASKREGVEHVFAAAEHALSGSRIEALSSGGRLVPLATARRRPLDFAATNWLAAALFLASEQQRCLLVDVGSTTTDIIPIAGGRVQAEGRTDPARLVSGELVYTGVIRTNPDTVTGSVPLAGRPCRLAAESFALMADVYLILGLLSPEDYTFPTPDGREKTPAAAAARLARLPCADAEMLTAEEIDKLARYLHERQLQQITDGLLQVLSRLDDGYAYPVVAAGSGAFLAAAAARRLGLAIVDPPASWRGAERALPAVACGCLLAAALEAEHP